MLRHINRLTGVGVLCALASLSGCEQKGAVPAGRTGAAAEDTPSESPASAREETTATATAPDGPNPLRNVYFGEQHMHTRNSFDAFTVGVGQTWEQAYRFAMGEEVTLSTTGEKMKRRTPITSPPSRMCWGTKTS